MTPSPPNQSNLCVLIGTKKTNKKIAGTYVGSLVGVVSTMGLMFFSLFLTLAGVVYTPKCVTNSYGYMGSGELPHGAR